MYKIFVYIFLFLFISSSELIFAGHASNDSTKTIVDCNYTFKEAIAGIKIPKKLSNELKLIKVKYYSFDGKIHQGQLLIQKDLVKDIEEIFNAIMSVKFPIAKVIPAVKYGWNDEKSMADNNTSAFNYRMVANTKAISSHSSGRAIDINPKFNPQIKRNHYFPRGSKYEPSRKGTITANSLIVKEFLKRGWMWGGLWHNTKDYQHFEKR